MILRDKDKNNSQEKETSESDENVKIENQEKSLGKQKAWEKMFLPTRSFNKKEK